jgi:regulator of PEP synthase PpsR (kinase-PPPase family)
MKKQLNLHLISDSTGETVTLLAKSVLSGFVGLEVREFHHFLVRNEAHMRAIVSKIEDNKGIVLYSILNDNLEDILKKECQKDDVCCIPAISPIVLEFEKFWGVKSVKNVGKQHEISEEYYKRMEAINYTLAHDDGNLAENLEDADIIILGVSRSSKSPTSIYLSYKGYKVGNIPFVKAELIPAYISSLKKPLIVGFTIDPERLKTIRQTRVKTLEVKEETDYTDLMRIKEEVNEAKRFFAKLEIPVINVTEKSIEETAVYVINLFEERKHDL